MQDKRAHGIHMQPAASGVRVKAPTGVRQTRIRGTNEGRISAGAGRAVEPPRRLSGRPCGARCMEQCGTERSVGSAPVRCEVQRGVRQWATRKKTGRTAGWRHDPRGRSDQAATHWTGIPSLRALSTRLSVMPEPGNAMTPLGRRSSSSSWSYPVSVDSLWLSPPALSWATAGGRTVFPKIGG